MRSSSSTLSKGAHSVPTGSLNWAASDSWDFGGGLRYSSVEKDFWVDMPQELFPGQLDEPITRQLEDNFTSWDLSATYKANQNVNIYGRVATGFRAPSIQGRILFCADFEGGLNPATNCVTIADEETILSFELGAKTIDEWGPFVREAAKMMRRVDPTIEIAAACIGRDKM